MEPISSEQQQTNGILLTEDEERVLGLDHWLGVFGRMCPSVPLIQADKDFLTRVTALIRKAYISLKETTGVTVDIVNLLDDKDSRNALFHLVFCLSRIDDYSAMLERLRLFWVQDYPHIFVTMDPFLGRSKFTANLEEASTKPLADGWRRYAKLEELGMGEKEAISIRIYSMLLILEEILTIMGVQPQVTEGNKRTVESCPELMRLVVDSAYHLANVTGKTDIVITKMLDSVYKEFPPDTTEHNLALVSDERRYGWTTKLQFDLINSIDFIRKDSAEIYGSKLRKLIDTIDPGSIFWYLN